MVVKLARTLDPHQHLGQPNWAVGLSPTSHSELSPAGESSCACRPRQHRALGRRDRSTAWSARARRRSWRG